MLFLSRHSLQHVLLDGEARIGKLKADYERHIERQHEEVVELKRRLQAMPPPAVAASPRPAQDQQHQALLEKENLYYKHTNKEMKKALRELIAANDQQQQEFERAVERAAQLQKINEDLQAELDEARRSKITQSRGAANPLIL
jgi:hypothetical protein